MFKNLRGFGFILLLAFILILAACGGETANEDALVDGDKIELAYVTWDTEVASTHVVGAVLDDLGYDTRLTTLDNAIMWEAIATGEADAMVSAWLPLTHAPQLEEYGDDIDRLGVNLTGGKIGYVVPTYMDVDSVEDLTTEADQTVVGIEPGSGTVAAAIEVAETYPNLQDWEVKTSSSGAMTTQLSQAIENEEEIVVTGWTPHWKFQKYDLKFLEEPEGIIGADEDIETFARLGLKEDNPIAYSVLENFEWEVEDIESVMLAIQEGASPEDAARNWVDENQDKVDEWTAQAKELATESD